MMKEEKNDSAVYTIFKQINEMGGEKRMNKENTIEKVYIILEHVYESVDFIGTFTTEKQAQEVKESLEQCTDNFYEIKELELNRLTREGTETVLAVISRLKKKCGLED